MEAEAAVGNQIHKVLVDRGSKSISSKTVWMKVEIVQEIVNLLKTVQYSGRSEQWTHLSICPCCKVIRPDSNGNSGTHSKNCELNNLLNILEKM